MLRRPQRRQAGVTLLEVLVALLLSAVALLALAGASATALRLGKMSQHRMNAALLAADMGERVRANPAAVSGKQYEFTLAWTSQTGVPEPPAACQGAASFCSAADLAAHDLTHWRSEARRLLPMGAVYLQSSESGNSGQSAWTTDIWVAWQEPAPARDAAGIADESPAAPDECPPGLGVSADPQVRCSHVRVHI